MLCPVDEVQIVKLLAKYKNVNATKKDIVDVLNHYKNLTYSLENFVFNDGTAKDMFRLRGTIPVIFKNQTYHIPICIFLMDTHPNNAPLCFVQPTPTMQIKVSMYVDHNGKVYLPYLHDWQPHKSDLLELIQIMIFTFGEYPPVYSKPKQNNAAPYPTSSFMPQPGGSGNGFQPFPITGGPGNFRPYPPPSNNFSTPYPPYPANQTNAAMPTTGSTTLYPQYKNFPAVPGYNAGYIPGSSSQTGTITEEHIKASLISAVEDKLRRRIQEKINQCHAEIETLNRTKQELVEGSAKIDEIISNFQREEIEIKKNIAVLHDKEQELEKALESIEKMDGMNKVDEAVITTAPLYRQLLNAYAEEAATEDAIYYLGEAVRNNVIDLETFLKHVRQLSRKQFMLRAIMQKCRQKAGLAG